MIFFHNHITSKWNDSKAVSFFIAINLKSDYQTYTLATPSLDFDKQIIL